MPGRSTLYSAAYSVLRGGSSASEIRTITPDRRWRRACRGSGRACVLDLGRQPPAEPVVAAGDCKPVETFEVAADGLCRRQGRRAHHAHRICVDDLCALRALLPGRAAADQGQLCRQGLCAVRVREFPLDRVALGRIGRRALPRARSLSALCRDDVRRTGDLGARNKTRVRLSRKWRGAPACRATSSRNACRPRTTRRRSSRRRRKRSKTIASAARRTFLLNGKKLANGEFRGASFDEKLRAELKAKGVERSGSGRRSRGRRPLNGDATGGRQRRPRPAKRRRRHAPPPTTPPTAPAPSAPATGTPTP